MSFDDLGLSPKVMAAVVAAGYETPTPIQAQSIPEVLKGRDVLGLAQTGTGKTASFTLPILTKLESGRARARMPRTLILEPTRELAAQVHESFELFGINHKLTIALLIGGVSFNDQFRKLDKGADVLIATPGRLLDHFERGKLMLNGVEVLVVDEADRMLDMGFIPDIERICKLLPPTRQTLFFSATMPPEIQRITSTFLHNPIRVEVAVRSAAASTITQKWVYTPGMAKDKRAKLRELLVSQPVKNAIVFCNRKRDVAMLEKSFETHKLSGRALHGDMNQHARMETLRMFKDGEITYLIASDVAARGLDIPDVSHVFNYDIPDTAEDYVHRIGRTGRAGKEGVALSLVTPADFGRVAAIEKLLGQDISWLGDEPTAEEREGGDKRRGRGGRGRKSEARASEPAKEKREAPKRRAAKSVDTAVADDEPAEVKPAETKPAETKPAETKPAEARKPTARRTRRKESEEDAPETAETTVSEDRPKRQRRREGAQKGETSWQDGHVPAFLQRSVRS